jgi:hypothetical protein
LGDVGGGTFDEQIVIRTFQKILGRVERSTFRSVFQASRCRYMAEDILQGQPLRVVKTPPGPRPDANDFSLDTEFRVQPGTSIGKKLAKGPPHISKTEEQDSHL